MSLPAGWPAPRDVETLPVVWLKMDGSAWPPADGDRPAGLVPVGTWSMERELVGSLLPGNVRARTGLSVGAASASIAQMAVAPLAPWAVDDDRRVTVGHPVDLYAAHDGHDDPIRVDLGDWVVAPTSGALLSPSVDIDLVERQGLNRTSLEHRLPTPLARIFTATLTELAWMPTTLAAQLGYHAVPPPVPSTILAVPAQGHVAALQGPGLPQVDTLTPAGPGGWDRSTGPIGAHRFLQFKYLIGSGEWLTAAGQSVYLTVNYGGTVEFWSEFTTAAGFGIALRPGGVLAVRVNPGSVGTWATGTFAAGDDPVHPNRVQVQIERTGTTSSMGVRVRARSSATAAWSAWITAPNTMAPQTFTGLMIDTPDTSVDDAFSALQITTSADPKLWAAPNADIDPLGVLVGAPWLPATTDAWTGIQEVCEAALGACWVTRDKTLMVRDRNYLAGVDRPAVEFDVARHASDIAWTMDPADTADRLVVTYQPMVTVQALIGSTPAFDVWSSDTVLRVPAGGTVKVVVELGGPVEAQIAPWVPAWDPTQEFFSTWSAFPNPDGTGAHAVDGALAIAVEWVNTGRMVLSVTNTTGTPLYTVDATGQPCLFARVWSRIDQNDPDLVVRGVSESRATNPLTIDLGRHVQRAQDAEAIADFIWARVSTPMWRADSVGVKLDFSHDIGEVLHLVHERSGLDVKALVTKVSYGGSPGQVSQSLDLVLLPPTWSDFDEAWVGKTWDDFDALWSAATWNDFDRHPLRSS